MLAMAIGVVAIMSVVYSHATAATAACAITTESNPSLGGNNTTVAWTWGVDCTNEASSYNVYTSANDVTTGKAYGITGTGSPFTAHTKTGATETKTIPACVATDQWTVKVAVRVAGTNTLVTGPTTTNPISLCPSSPPPPPTVSITNPTNGSTVPAASDELDATATNAASVAFSVDGNTVGTDTTAPYTANWNATGQTVGSSHTITATATNTTGFATATSTVTIAPPPAPTVVITKPADGSTVPAASDELDATASNAASVAFAVDGNTIATDTSAPYTTNWDASAAAPGSQHAITATATNVTGTAAATSTVTIAQPGTISHIITLFDENHNQTTVTPTSMPYLSGLKSEFASTNNYSAIQKGSLGNYMAATSGFNLPSADCQASSSTCASTNDNIFNQLNGRWQAIAQSMPSNCYKSNYPTGATSTNQTYVPRHNPAVYYSVLASTCSTNDIPQGATVSINPNAAYTWITPDLNNDAHNGSLISADNYLKNVVPQLLADPNYTNGSTLIELSWDEGSSTNEQVLTVFLHPSLDNSHKVLTGAYTHYSLLRLNEEILGLPILGNAQTANDMRTELGL
jgi:hypothetical protein